MDNGYGMAGAFDNRSLVGADKAVRRGFGEGLLQQAEAEALRGLRQDDELAGDGGRDEGAVGGALDLLDGVDGGQADDGRAEFDDSVDGAVDGGRVDERTDGVVDQDDVVGVGGECGEGVRDGLLAVVAACYDANAAGDARGREANSAICASTRSISVLRTAT